MLFQNLNTFVKRECLVLTEERRLISIGYPADEAICMCHAMRRDGTLAEFVRREEEKYRNRCREHVKEVID